MTLAITLKRARKIAGDAHEAAGDRYGDHPYTAHLDEVRSIAFEFGVIDEDIIVATLLHDTIEDTELTKEDVREEFGERVAALVDAVSDPPGYPNRKTRKAAAYPRIRDVLGATTLKLADRIANVRSCWRVAKSGQKRSKSLIGMYKREYGGFRKALRLDDDHLDPIDRAMWDEMDRLLAWRP